MGRIQSVNLVHYSPLFDQPPPPPPPPIHHSPSLPGLKKPPPKTKNPKKNNLIFSQIMDDQENNPSSSSPPPPAASNPSQPKSQPEPQPSASASSNPSSPEDTTTKPNIEIVPISTPEANPNPIATRAPKSPSSKKNAPLPWTHQETISLIQTYQEKWYSLKKGQLKANQWEDVAAAVAARCGYDSPSKTSTQCRHKIEKLRKRYRAERLKPYPNSWQYYELMDHMERGPMPITATRSAPPVKYQNQKNAGASGFLNNYRENNSDEGGANYGGFEAKKNKSKSINNIVRGSGVDMGNRNLNKIGMSRNFGFGEELEAEVEEKGKGVLVKALAAEVRGFAERFLKMENDKIELMRKTEKTRMEMEKNRMDMILEAQRKVVDTIGKAFGAHKKPKRTAPES
ncbi:OLC1v1006780C1 [Oldenlandia corymbosa var. corymbosa]|uniref:OLC1v1006780C1 n=1 Tax=Oldenlandia corymbosa var. corymbosa TaxID=529605 RepID=A0AAV1DK82_OLDCO|nr:OLC1v1006780C1 [Oldenlandia corymbosa var. corymbosa]